MQNPTTQSELLATIQTDYQALLDQVQRNHYRWATKLIGQWKKAQTKRKAG